MNFGIIILNESISKMENYATRIQIALLFILRLKMSIRILEMMLKKDLMKSIDHYEEVKIRK